MRREIHQWWSPSLGQDMPVVCYGHHGIALLMFPTAAADYLEYERFHMIDFITPYIEMGKIRVYSINSINAESWMNGDMHPAHKAIRHQEYNNYIYNEVVPFIWHDSGERCSIITTGISMGTLHAGNVIFQRPDLFDGGILMSGSFDLKRYTDGHWDENVYYNSPVDYLNNLNSGWQLDMLRQKQHIHIVTGQGAYEAPDRSIELAYLLRRIGVPCELDLWGHDMRHDWPTWYKMLPYYLDTRF